jgi:putative tributyrin esterase
VAIATVQFMSAALWRVVTYTVLLPKGDTVGPGPYPALYQLHGGNENHTAWLHNSTLARHVRDLPLIVVLPDGAQTRWANGGQPFTHYEDFLVQDLAEHLRRTFRTTASNWAIGGNSMGGLGAMRLGLKYPHLFTSVWAHSGVYPTAEILPEHWHWIGSADDLDCYQLAIQADPQTLPRISFDCGHDDHLLTSNRAFHAFLEQRAIPHTYREHPGSHNWNYWEEHIDDALQQHIAVLKPR